MYQMTDIFELLEIIGWDVQKESWYDEEGIEGTRLISPDDEEFCIYGWDNDCELDELIKELEKE